MNRRKLLKRSVLLGAVGVVGGSGIWMLSGYDVTKLTIAQARKDLTGIDLSQASLNGGWNMSQVLNHLAQSIEYSMTGYPEHKSERFKETLGQAAFSVFSYRGRMTHDLIEPIPGAPILQADNTKMALNRLLMALDDFSNFKGDLKAHFAYGKLNHAEYTLAHVMHINNHLEEVLG